MKKYFLSLVMLIAVSMGAKAQFSLGVKGGVDFLGLTADLRYEGGLSKLNPSYGQRANIWSVTVGFKLL